MLWSQLGQMANTGAMPPVKHCFVTVPNATKAEILPKGGVQESHLRWRSFLGDRGYSRNSNDGYSRYYPRLEGKN